jgi:hypothetical protein
MMRAEEAQGALQTAEKLCPEIRQR